MTARSSSPAPALWQLTAPAGPTLSSLSGAVETDVLVVGGGVAGMSAALHLAEAGVDVVLAEAGQPGSAATGQSGGLIAPDYIRHTPESIVEAFGAQAGERLTDMLGHSAQRCFDLIARHAIDCDSRQDGFYTPVHLPRLADAQRAVAAQWETRGFDVSFMEGGDLHALFGTDAYCGALRFGRGGSLNPLAYVRGLARAAVGAGARLYQDTPVQKLACLEQGRWHARTPAGSVVARRIVLAANGANADLHPAMRRTALPLNVVEFATSPLPSELRARILRRGGAFTDKSSYIFSARYDGEGRLISAFPRTLLVRGAQAFRNEAQRRLTKYFKDLEGVQIESLWEGVAWVNTSFLPEIYDLGDGAIAIQACNGRGIATNTVIGAELAEALAAGDFGALSIRPRHPRPVSFYAAAARAPEMMMTLAYLTD